MPEEKNAQVATESAQADDSGDNKENGNLLHWQNEAKAHAKEAQGLRSRLKELENRAASEERKALEQQGKYKELFEAKEKEVLELISYRDMAEQTSDKYKSLSKVTDNIISLQVPENFRKLIPNLPIEEKLQWVEEATKSGLFKRQAPVNSGHAAVSLDGKFNFNSLDTNGKRGLISSFGGGRKL